MRPDFFLIAGEASGDLLGSSIVQALREHRKDLEIVGVGGPLMRKGGLYPIIPMEELPQVMGFTKVVRHLPHLLKIFRKTVDSILELNPQVVITIDYPGFNLRLAKTLRKRGYQGKICHVVCPSVWAWGKKRIQTIASNYDLLLTLFPFEKQLFQNTSLQVEYLVHPAAQTIAYEETPEEGLIALFPGSRQHEIEKNLPFFLRLIPKLKPKFKFVLSLSNEQYRPLLQKMAPSIPLLLPHEMKQRKPMLAIAKCGTIVLELALRGIPTVVTYSVSQWDTFLAQKIFRIHLPYYSLPNIILNRQLFPELIGPSLTDQALLSATSSLLEKRSLCHLDCKDVRDTLCNAPSSQLAPLLFSLLSSKITSC